MFISFIPTTYRNFTMLPAYWRIGSEAPRRRFVAARISAVIFAIANLREDVGRLVVTVRHLCTPRLAIQTKFGLVDFPHVKSTIASDAIVCESKLISQLTSYNLIILLAFIWRTWELTSDNFFVHVSQVYVWTNGRLLVHFGQTLAFW